MADVALPADMMKVQPDVGSIFAVINTAGVEGPIKEYCLSMINGVEVTPDLAKAAYLQAKTLVDAGNATNSSDVSIGAGKTVAVDILEALMDEIKSHVKFAASRQNMLKLANKFARLIK